MARVLPVLAAALLFALVAPLDAAATVPTLPVTSGLVAWYAADAIAGAVDGQAVQTWPDSSGNGWTASQPLVDQQPTFRANRVNGLPVVEFDGHVDPNGIGSDNTTGTWLATGSHGTLSKAHWTIFVVANIRPTGAGCCPTLYGEARNDTQTQYSILRVANSSTLPQFVVNAGAGESSLTMGTVLDPTAFYSLVAERNGKFVQMFLNGTTRVTGTTTVLPTQPVTQTSIGVLHREDFQDFFNGQIAELLIYSQALSVHDRLAVQEYLRARYNLYPRRV